MGIDLKVWIPIISVILTGIFAVAVAYINRQNKPVRDVLKNTRIKGNGSLVEAIGVLQKEYTDSQSRHQREIEYFVSQITAVRAENQHLRDEVGERDKVIVRHEREIATLKSRLDRAHLEV